MDCRRSLTKKQGSFTVEAALIMPVILGIIVLLIYIACFLFDRCTIEYAVRTACMMGVYEEGRYSAEQHIDSILPPKLILDWDTQAQVSEDDNRLTVTVSAVPKLYMKRFIHSAYALKHFCPNY